MSKIQKTAKQALITFKTIDTPSFSANLERLKAMMYALTASDINLDIPTKSENKDSRKGGAPVSYISIFDSKYFSLGVFILKNRVSIPLHDHPGMFGICKVLYGAVKVKCFDPVLSNGNRDQTHFERDVNGKLIKCSYVGEKIFTSENNVCHLTPSSGNYHSVHAHEGQAAFLDILGPPYVTGERDCSYFREYKNIDRGTGNLEEEKNVRWLMEIPQPTEFFCDSLPYKGPPIDLEE